MSDDDDEREIRVWIAMSSAHHPAPFIGYAFTRKNLLAQYQQRYGQSLTQAGYRAVKVRLIYGE